MHFSAIIRQKLDPEKKMVNDSAASYDASYYFQ